MRPLLALLAAALLALAVAPTASAQFDPCDVDPDLPFCSPDPPVAPQPRPQAPAQPSQCGSAAAAGRVRSSADPRGVRSADPNPLAGLRFYVDPTEEAYIQSLRFKRQGKEAEAALLWKIASQPRFRWFGKFTRGGAGMPGKVRRFIGCAEADGSVPLMVVLRHQGKACNPRYMAGGRAEDARTREWYDDFARAAGSSRVVIGFEPDSLGTIDCLARSRRQARLETLRYGVDVLSKLPNATIYLEAGASDWEPAGRVARNLRFIGIAKVRGFMLNVTHYDWTSNNIRYGQKVSRRVGGKPFIVSTSYNGRGPVHYDNRVNGRMRRINVYCNPQLRGLGPPPTTATGHGKVDAFMWMNRPGISGAGGCNGAPPRAGTWWTERALMFAQYATDWVRPPRGTRFGFKRGLSLCRLGAPIRGYRYSHRAPGRRCR